VRREEPAGGSSGMGAGKGDALLCETSYRTAFSKEGGGRESTKEKALAEQDAL